MDIASELLNLIEQMQNGDIDFALCGGMAMALHGYPRYTKGIDFLIRAQDGDRAVAAVAKCGFDVDCGIMPFGTQGPRSQQIRRVTKVVGAKFLTLDLLYVASFLEDIWESRTTVLWGNRTVSVVSAVGLAKMKRLAGRPQDRVDIQHLGFDPDDPALSIDSCPT